MITPMIIVLASLLPAQTNYSDQTVPAGLIATHTPASSHPFPYMAAGGSVGDFNLDGWPDLYVCGGGGVADKLFINQGDGTFLDQAPAWLIDDSIFSVAACAGDYNRDGWTDLYVTCWGDPVNGSSTAANRLYRNNGNGTFSDVALSAGIATTSLSLFDYTPIWNDFDHDGWLDLFVCSYDVNFDPNHLFHNNQDGTFSDVTLPAGLAMFNVHGLAATFTDFDGDRWPELVVAGDFGSNRYFVNNRNGSFTNSSTGIPDFNLPDGMGFAVGDFDNDLDIDFYMSDIYWPISGLGGNHLYSNQGNHVFTDNVASTGAHAAGWSWGSAATDVDNDGLLDLIVTNGWSGSWDNYPTKLFLNLGGMTFTELSSFSNLLHYGQGRGLVRWDPDQDGDQDLVIFSHGEPLVYFRNELANGNSWIDFDLDTSGHPALAPDGIGTRVVVKSGTQQWVRQLDSNSSYLAQNENYLHFGLGGVSTVNKVTIEWANGFDTILKNLAVNQRIVVSAVDPFDCTPLQRGQATTLTLDGIHPGELAWFVYSTKGFGATPPVAALGGLRLDLLAPVSILGNATANVDGLAKLQKVVPTSAPLINIYLQAVVSRGAGGSYSIKSNPLARMIQ